MGFARDGPGVSNLPKTGHQLFVTPVLVLGGDRAHPWRGLAGGGDLHRGRAQRRLQAAAAGPAPGSSPPAVPVADSVFQLLYSGF